MVLTKGQRAALQRAQATANEVLPKIELLERVGEVSPAFRERAAELRTRRDYILRVAEAALSFDDSASR